MQKKTLQLGNVSWSSKNEKIANICIRDSTTLYIFYVFLLPVTHKPEVKSKVGCLHVCAITMHCIGAYLCHLGS